MKRFETLFKIPENLYLEGAPVVIEAGALLQDTINNGMLAQLKFKNLCAQPLQMLKVSIICMDIANRQLGEAIEFTYLDCGAKQYDSFGSKVAINLPDSTTRSYTVSVVEAVFEDKSIWKADVSEWRSLKKQELLTEHFSDLELVKQYKLAIFSNTAKYIPEEYLDLWFCANGTVVKQAEEKCPCCEKNREEQLRALDLQLLTEARDERLEREAKEAEEKKIQAEKDAKKLKKIITISIPIVCIIIAFCIILNTIIIPSSKYKNAISLMETGKYDEAISAFEAMNGYKDSETMIKYTNAIARMKSGEYTESIAIFESLGDYKDSKDQIKECMYLAAKDSFREGDYIVAINTYAHIRGYKDADELIEESKNMQYEYCMNLIENQKYEEAYNGFLEIQGYSDVDTMLEHFQFLPTIVSTETQTNTSCKYSFSYDKNGNMKSATDILYNDGECEFDDSGNLISIRNGYAVYAISYPEGKPRREEKSGGFILYDENGHKVYKKIPEIIKGNGDLEINYTFECDEKGNLVKGKDVAYDVNLAYEYDDKGRLINVKGAKGFLALNTTITYECFYFDKDVDNNKIWRNIRLICGDFQASRD